MDAVPLVGVLLLAPDHLKTLENVDNVINAPSLDREFFGAAVQVKHVAFFLPVENQETFAELAEALLFA